MSGFKKFVLRGNLVDVAVAFVVGVAFASVVTTFVAWLTAQLPATASSVFSNEPNSFGAFLNAVIAFLILAAVIYFFVVVPYTKAKERFFPDEPAGPTEIDLLAEIRDALVSR
jgi:large conductance mechanosensitive channel